MTDQRIIARVLSGHRDEFSILVDRYLPMVYSLVRSRLGYTEDAEDAVQEAFLRAFSALDTLRDRKRFRPWLAVIARHACGDIVRKARRDGNFPEEGSDEKIVRSDPERRELHEVLRREIDLLAPAHREVLLLHYFAGMKIREIADALNLSSSAVAKRIQRGREALEISIREELGEAALSLNTSWEKRRTGIMSVVLVTPVSWEISAQGLMSTAPVILTGGDLVMKNALVWGSMVVLVGLSIFGIAFMDGDGISMESTAITAPVLTSTPSAPLPSSKPTESPEPISSDILFTVAKTTLAPVAPRLEKGELTEPSEHCTISGRVSDDQGRPILGASVWVIASGDDEAPGDPRVFSHATRLAKGHHFTAITDYRGDYSVSGISFAGTAVIWASKKGYATRFATDSAFPNVIKRRFELEPGDKLENVNLTLRSGITLKGRVLASDGTPVIDGVVGCMTAWGMPINTVQSNAGLAYTDEGGNFHLGYLASVHSCNLQVSSETYGLCTFRDVSITDQEVVLQYVEPASLTGTITRSDGSAAEGSRVRLRGTVNRPTIMRGGYVPSPGSEYSAGVDDQGQYRIDGIDSGQSYTTLVYSSDGLLTSPKSEPFSMAPAEIKEWNFALPGGVTIRGRVIGEKSGRPLSHIRVRCLKDGMPIQWHEGQETEIHVDENGKYEFQFLTGAGEYTVFPISAMSGSYFDPGYTQYSTTVKLEGGEKADVDIKCFEPVTLTVRVASPDGRPLQGIPLFARQEVQGLGPVGNGRIGVTDELGQLSYSGFEPGFEAWFRVRSSESYAAAESHHYHGEPGQTIFDETLVLYPHAGVEGRVTDAQGYALSDTSLSIVVQYDQDREVRVSARTGPDGDFHLPKGIPATWAALEITVEDGSDTLRWTSESVEFFADHVLDFGTIVLIPTEASFEQK